MIPAYGSAGNEYEVLGTSAEEWERYAEDGELYRERASGRINADTVDCEYWQGLPLHPLLGNAVFSCDAGLLKPDREIYEYALRWMGAEARCSLFVGDGGSDELDGARQAGMRTVLSEALIRWKNRPDGAE